MSLFARSLLALALAALLHAVCAWHPLPNLRPTPGLPNLRPTPGLPNLRPPSALPNLRPTPALPGRYCNKHEIGDSTVSPSQDTVKITQLFHTNLGQDEYLIDVSNYCAQLRLKDGIVGVHYVMTRETVEVCAGTPVRVLDVGADVFSPVVAVCEITGECGALQVTVDQYCELRPVVPNWHSG